MESLDQAHTGKNEEPAHYHRTEDSPKKDAVLLLLGSGEVAEDHEENEEIIHAERKFEDIAGDELKCDLAPLPKKNNCGEGYCKSDPHGAPGEGFARAHDAAAAMEDGEIQHQHAEREKIEKNPEVEQGAS
jgi:hypothetical protein